MGGLRVKTEHCTAAGGLTAHRHTALILLLMIFGANRFSLGLRKGTSTEYRRSTEKRTIFNGAIREGGTREDCH